MYDIYTSSSRTRRGGSCLKLYYKTFDIYRTCVRRAPAKPGVCAVCECVALLPSRNMTCVRPPCTARSREDSLDTSQFRLHSLHFKSHTSSHLKLHCNIFFHTANFYTEKPFNTEAKSFCIQKVLHRSLYIEKPEGFAHRCFYTEKLEVVTHTKL